MHGPGAGLDQGARLGAASVNVAERPGSPTGRDPPSRQLVIENIDAGALGVSPGTAKRHIHNIYRKLGVSGRRKLLARAIGLGVLETGLPVAS